MFQGDDDGALFSEVKSNANTEHKVEPVVPAKRLAAVDGKTEPIVPQPVESKSIVQVEPETETESESEGDTTAETEDEISIDPEVKKTEVEKEKANESEAKSHANIVEPAVVPKLDIQSKSAVESPETVNDKSVDTSAPPTTTISSEKHAPSKPARRPLTSKSVDVPPHKLSSGSSISKSIGGPLTPTSTSDSISSTDSTGLHSKKPPPKVPKKPSSKIAEFQQRLAQQQQQDIGMLAKHHAPPPKPKPKRVISHESDNGDDEDKYMDRNDQESVPVVKPKKVGKLNSAFAKNLDGMLGRGLPGMVPGMGMPLPGMVLGGGLPPALAAKMAANHGTDDDEDKNDEDMEEKKEVEKPEKKVTDARKGRAKGPRGRKLPGKVKEKIVVNDDTLGVSGPKLSVFTVDSLWSIKPKFDEADFDSSVDVSKSSDVTGHDHEDSGSFVHGHGTERRVSSKDILTELKSKVGDDTESTLDSVHVHNSTTVIEDKEDKTEEEIDAKPRESQEKKETKITTDSEDRNDKFIPLNSQRLEPSSSVEKTTTTESSSMRGDDTEEFFSMDDAGSEFGDDGEDEDDVFVSASGSSSVKHKVSVNDDDPDKESTPEPESH
ncbi:unnamed protein product [Ambrosiozyma monospora]|uniref:Altered inheritance of mitochondria protein 21 n=1 Tax=Ambrosiozyma monospora TaxID=43982 RepID=A0A9W7DHP6_AMBMO|nr:unnamed protein product [Ambrosiozyma monospora]